MPGESQQPSPAKKTPLSLAFKSAKTSACWIFQADLNTEKIYCSLKLKNVPLPLNSQFVNSAKDSNFENGIPEKKIPDETNKFSAPFESCKGGCDYHL